MHATNQTNNNSASAIDLTYIYTLSIVKIKSIGNQTNSPKIRKDSCNHLRKLVLINTFIERKMAVYGEILKSKRSQQQQQQRQQLVHQLPPLTPPPSPPMNKRFVIAPPQNVQQKQQLPSLQPPSQPPSQQPPSQEPSQQSLQQSLQQPPQQKMKKAGYSYGGGFKRVQQKQQRQRPFQVVQPIQIYGNQIPMIPQKTGFNSVQQPQIHWIPIQVPAQHRNHQMHYGVNGYSMVQTQEQQLYLQQHVFLPPHPRGPHAPLAKLVRRPQLVRM